MVLRLILGVGLVFGIVGCKNNGKSIKPVQSNVNKQENIETQELFQKTKNFQEAKKINERNGIVTFEVNSSYVLGDGDNKVDARNIALQQAKVLASEQAGTYIESSFESISKVENDLSLKSVKRHIKSISMALTSTTIKEEKYSLTSAGKIELTLFVVAKLNKSSLANRIENLAKDDIKQKKIATLQKQNKELLDKLIELNSKISMLKSTDKPVSTIPSKQLFEERNRILAKIENTEKNIKRVFLEKGSLFKLAFEQDKEHERLIKEAKDDIRLNVFDYIKNNIEYEIGELKVVSNHDGTANLVVAVKIKILGWQQQKEEVFKYFEQGSCRESKYVPNVNSCFIDARHLGSDLKKEYRSIIKWLKSQKSIALKLKLNSKLQKIVDILEIEIYSDGSGSNLKIFHTKKMAVVFRSIPLFTLKNLTSIEAEIIER
jgi:hypothetical protein